MKLHFVYTENEWEELKVSYPLGTVFESSIVKKIPPSLLIVGFVEGKNAILPLNNLGRNLAQSQLVFQKLKVYEPEEFIITEFNDETKTVIVSRKEVFQLDENSNDWEKIKLGEDVPGKIIDLLPTMALVQLTDSVFGILKLDGEEYSIPKAGSNRKFKVIGKNVSSNYLELKKITRKKRITSIQEDNAQINDFEIIDNEMTSYSTFQRSNLFTYTPDSDKEVLKKAFEKDNNLFSKAIKFPKTLHFTFQFFEQSWEHQFKTQFIPYLGEKTTQKDALKYLESQKYWCSFNCNRNGQDEINLFNKEILLIGTVDSSEAFYKINISGFTFDSNEEWSGKKKNWLSRNQCFLLDGDTKILSPYEMSPMDNSQEINFNLIKNKTEAFRIYEEISREQGAILKEEGRALEIFDKFLEYQADRNTKESYNTKLYVSGEKIRPVFNADSDGLKIELDFVVQNEQQGTIANDSMVKILLSTDKRSTEDENLQYIDHAKCFSTDENTYLTFNQSINLEILQEGFYIVPVVSNSQFNVQRLIIQEFFNKEIKIKHIEDLLLKPEKIRPPENDKSFTLINNRLQQTEKNNYHGNNQIKAVRKAVGNNNIFMIQGPPGTGKTTVIAEVVEQLIKRGEKVLVSSQTHIAVDNVLEKLSELEDLNLLRIGSYSKLSDSVKHYHIDGWIKFYAEDYARYSQNNLEFLKILNKDNPNIHGSELKDYKKKLVNEVSDDYNFRLKDRFKSRHHEFLDVIFNMSNRERIQIEKVLGDWVQNVKQDEELAKSVVYNSVDVAFGTCIGIKTDRDFTDRAPNFDTVIIDEAGKANLAETFVPISMAKKVILVGDQKQLPPYLDSSLLDEEEPNSFPRSEFGKGFLKEEIEHALKTSFFEFLINKKNAKLFPLSNIEMLNFQHRMHPHIGEFVSKAFYGGEVKMGDSTHLNKLELPSPFNKEIVFINTSSGEDPYESKHGDSVQNRTEAVCIANYILPKLIEYGVKSEEMAIISPYSSQVQTIKKAISGNHTLATGNFEVSTLDSFQGMEFDIILFSFTRSASPKQQNKRVGFLDDARRLNVAFSRAKKKLILVGNAKTLMDKRSHFDYMFDYTTLFKNLVDLSKDKNIGNFIELAEFADISGPFTEFHKRNKVGDTIKARYKMSNEFGHYFNLAPEIDGMVYDRNKFLTYETDHFYDLELESINEAKKRIGLNDKRLKTTYERDEIHWTPYKRSIHSGHFFALSAKDVFIYDPRLMNSYEEGTIYPVRIDRVDNRQNRISGKVLHQGMFIKGRYLRKEGEYLVFGHKNYEFKVIRTQKTNYIKEKLYPFRIKEITPEDQEIIVIE